MDAFYASRVKAIVLNTVKPLVVGGSHSCSVVAAAVVKFVSLVSFSHSCAQSIATSPHVIVAPPHSMAYKSISLQIRSLLNNTPIWWFHFLQKL